MVDPGGGPGGPRERLQVDELTLAQLAELAASEDEAIASARRNAGPDPTLPSPPAGALLSWLAALLGARSVVELGSAAGLSGLFLLRGMADRGTLTTVDPDPDGQDLARRAFERAGLGDRVRSIPGEPGTALERLSDGGYDLAVVQSVEAGHGRLLAHLRRILRADGVLFARGVAVGEGAALAARREFVRSLVDDPSVDVAVLPLDGGTVVARFAATDEGDPPT